MEAFKKRLTEYQTFLEKYLDETCFVYDSEPQKELFSAMRYSLLAGGKRLRPVFVFEFCRMCGGDWKAAAPFAAAVEMVHTYSLIHDDLPCMDNDDYRRGRLTNHKVYGEAMAVLAGDGLLTAAFSRLSDAPYSAETRIKAVQILSQCAGELGMVGGQVLDMESERRDCTEREILDIQSRKTGALIRAACFLGVLAGGGTGEQMEAAGEFASHLGLAFQIRDDILDKIGDAETLGKAVGVDEGKNTFLRLYGMDTCQALVRQHTEKALGALSVFPERQWMTELAGWLTDRTY
ncbi:MAG: farnesyl diphosphate synthase [Candidatus Faecousia sp.]|nr:polyprenyl synthetase family protein [Bacillota bacterium]MDY4220447.1 farnesyl diphosphate synthase [Candidatus Faecousia sp.]